MTDEREATNDLICDGCYRAIDAKHRFTTLNEHNGDGSSGTIWRFCGGSCMADKVMRGWMLGYLQASAENRKPVKDEIASALFAPPDSPH